MNKELLNKIKNCKTKEEVEELVKANIKELSDLNLEKVQGGSDDPQLPSEQDKQQEQEDRDLIQTILDAYKDLLEGKYK